MDRFAMTIASGATVFWGGAILVVVALGDVWLRGRAWDSVARGGLAIGVVLIAISSTPLPALVYVAWALPVACLLLDRCRKRGLKERRRLALALATVAASLVCAGVELPRHLRPRFDVPRPERVVVIGDSITAGIDNRTETWPEIWRRRLGIELIDLSDPGLRQAGAIDRAIELGDSDLRNTLVVLEIGGNDVLGDANAQSFAIELDELLDRASGQARTVVLLELPLPPFYNRYGQAQRRLTRKHGAMLIPKRYFAKLLATPGATTDGLHLSSQGQQQMADMLWGLILGDLPGIAR